MDRNEICPGYQETEKLMKEIDRLDDVISAREGGNKFYLPDDFDPNMSCDEEINVSQRCGAIERELNTRGFRVDLDQNTPMKARYLYLQYISLITEGLKLPEKHNIVFTGCTGWCEDCFQRAWCDAKKEIDREEMLENSSAAV